MRVNLSEGILVQSCLGTVASRDNSNGPVNTQVLQNTAKLITGVGCWEVLGIGYMDFWPADC